jgi:hypothetical protein
VWRTCSAMKSASFDPPGGAGGQHAGHHPFDHVAHVPARGRAVGDSGPGRRDRAAGVVAKHHHETTAEHAHPVFDAAEDLRADDVTGGPHHEEVTQPTVEDDLGGQS